MMTESRATEGREPCQMGNQAAISDTSVCCGKTRSEPFCFLKRNLIKEGNNGISGYIS